jgi:hypothetical protein
MDLRGFIGFLPWQFNAMASDMNHPMIYTMIPSHPMANESSDESSDDS